MMPTIPVPREEVEREGVPPSYSRYGYDVYHPSYQSGGGGGGGATIIFKVPVRCLPSQLPERRRSGRGCHHHIQGIDMMSTIPTTIADVGGGGGGGAPSYSRYRYDAYHPSYQRRGGGGGGATIIFKVPL